MSDCQHPYLSVAGDGYAVCNSCDQTVYIGDETEPRLTQAGQDELNRQAFGGPEAEARIKAIEREAQAATPSDERLREALAACEKHLSLTLGSAMGGERERALLKQVRAALAETRSEGEA